MSHPVKPCGVCGTETSNVHDGLFLCPEHSAVLYRVTRLKAAQTDPSIDLTGLRSQGERDSHDGGKRRAYDVVPEDDVEEVERDVKIDVSGVPLWAVESLFHRIHKELDSPDLDDWSATLFISYQGLGEGQYEKLFVLRDTLWANFEVEVVKTKLLAPRKLREKRATEAQQERERDRQE